LHLNKNLLLLHITVFIWGFTAIFGALISVSAYELVWYRMLIASLSLMIYEHFWVKTETKLNFKRQLKLLGIGGIVALHWFFFYHSIKTSTISVSLVCLSSSALFTSFLSPIFNKKKHISIVDLLIGTVIILGIILIFSFESRYTEGIIYGLFASLFATIFTILNEIEVKGLKASTIGKYEMIGGFVCISLYMLLTNTQNNYQLNISSTDLIYLLVLGTVCTALAYVMGVAVMKELSAYTVVLTTNLEPVYGIILAVLIFGKRELMTAGFYQGAAIILVSVFVYPFVKTYFNRKSIG
jgi:drug/metabolite transporter (DMT)-like permease